MYCKIQMSFLAHTCDTEEALISGTKYRVSDYQLSASSEYPGGAYNHGAEMSRLHHQEIRGQFAGAWCASHPLNIHQWIQVFIIVAFFENATIEYSLESLCVCVCVCFCTITQKENDPGT